MLNKLNASDRLQRRLLVFGERHQVFYVDGVKGYRSVTELIFRVLRHCCNVDDYLVSIEHEAPGHPLKYHELVVKREEWFMVGFRYHVDDAKGVMARVVFHNGNLYLEFMDAVAWKAKYGQVEVVEEAV